MLKAATTSTAKILSPKYRNEYRKLKKQIVSKNNVSAPLKFAMLSETVQVYLDTQFQRKLPESVIRKRLQIQYCQQIRDSGHDRSTETDAQ
jgi:hypothetical protein